MNKKIILLLPAVFLSGCVTTNTVNVKNTLKLDNSQSLIEILETDEVQKERLSVARKKPATVKQKSTRDLRKLRKMARRIIKKSPTPSLKIPIRLKKCGRLMAEAASSDGTVTICKETLKQLKYEDEVAFLLAHEMSHHILNHAPEISSYMAEQKTQDIDNKKAVGTATATALSLSNNISNYNYENDSFNSKMLKVGVASGVYFDKIQPHLSKGHGANLNRKEESEADALAIDLMSKAGWNPQSSIRILTIVEAVESSIKDDDNKNKGKKISEHISELGVLNLSKVIDKASDALINAGADSLINSRNHDKTSKRMEFTGSYIKKFYKQSAMRKKKRF